MTLTFAAAAALAWSSIAMAALPRDLPRPADVERIMMELTRCEGEGCPPPPQGAIVRDLRCVPDAGWQYEGRTRLICTFSGRWFGPGRADRRLDCAYLWREPGHGSWTLMALPDADLCEGYKAELADAPVIR